MKTAFVTQSACACGGKCKTHQPPTLTQEVQKELDKHPDCIAAVNEQSGDVRTFIVPKPYWEPGEKK